MRKLLTIVVLSTLGYGSIIACTYTMAGPINGCNDVDCGSGCTNSSNLLIWKAWCYMKTGVVCCECREETYECNGSGCNPGFFLDYSQIELVADCVTVGNGKKICREDPE